ncbi:MAG: HDOD domain-containing protein [Wenzhouxiangella sp.]|jgi:EAL and modified HD-GYP domain-containing signal transduction protein|nr:HDOD domain-containing protein [Wenzhouxiangella sp.]
MTESEGHGIALQPICDGALRHVGDKLLYRESSTAQAANVNDALLATARACSSVLFDIGLPQLVGDRFLLCTIPDEWLHDPEAILYPPEQTILEFADDALKTPEAAKAVARLQSLGFRIAMDAGAYAACRQQLAAPPDVIKTDFRKSQTRSAGDVPASSGSGPVEMATFIETAEQLEQARSAGFDWLQGFVFSLPVVIPKTTHKRSGNRAVELQLLAELAHEDFSLRQLEPLLAQHPSLATLLLRQANSAALGPRGRTIETLSEAMMRIGAQRMRTLVSTFMLSSNDPIRSIQARGLLVRAAMASNVAERIASISAPVAFSVGFFSRLDVFEGQPMEDLVRGLPLSTPVTRALTHGEGELGKLLRILDEFESGRTSGLGEPAISMLNEDYLRATAWADSWLRSDDSTATDQSGSALAEP